MRFDDAMLNSWTHCNSVCPMSYDETKSAQFTDKGKDNKLEFRN